MQSNEANNVLKGRLQTWLAEHRPGLHGHPAPAAARDIHYHWDHRESALLVDFSALIGAECAHAVSSWSTGLVVISCNQNRFEEGSVDTLMLPFQEDHRSADFQAWFRTMPEALRAALQNIPGYRYRLALLASRSTHCFDLVCSNANLCFLLAHAAAKIGLADAELIDLASRKRTEVLARIGLPAQPRVLKLVRKIDLTGFEALDVQRALHVLADPSVCAALSHEPVLVRKDFLILQRYPWAAGRPILRLLRQSTDRLLWECIDDSLEMAGEQVVRQIIGLTCRAQLERLHDRLVERQLHGTEDMFARYDSNGEIRPFPRPPLPNSATIIALTSPVELYREARTLHHCVPSYSDRIYDGHYAVYKVLEPERLTLGLRIRKGRVMIDQLRGYRNHRPSEAARQAVERWFHDSMAVNASARVDQVGADRLPGIDPAAEGDDEDRDPLFDEAEQIVIESRRGSITALQRQLKIGYNRAARLIDALERHGVVGPADTNGGREVLAPPPQD